MAALVAVFLIETAGLSVSWMVGPNVPFRIVTMGLSASKFWGVLRGLAFKTTTAGLSTS